MKKRIAFSLAAAAFPALLVWVGGGDLSVRGFAAAVTLSASVLLGLGVYFSQEWPEE